MLVCMLKERSVRKTAAEAAETRQAILRAALAEFSQRGYSATTLEGVARAAGGSGVPPLPRFNTRTPSPNRRR